MGIAGSPSRSPFARGTAPAIVDTGRPASAGRWRIGRAYRAGRLVCGCVHVRISRDERLGLTQRERRMIRVRFHEPVDDDLRAELTELAHRRRTASHRAAERITPIELVVDAPQSEHERMVGVLQPADRDAARGRPEEVDRRAREVERGRRRRAYGDTVGDERDAVRARARTSARRAARRRRAAPCGEA
jgi:hypothetical protein